MVTLKGIVLSERSPSQKSYMLYVSIYMTFSEGKTIGTEQISGCPGLGVTLIIKGQHRRILGADGAVLYPDCEGGHTDLYMC